MNAMQTQVKGDDTCENMVAVCNHHASAKLVPSLSLSFSLSFTNNKERDVPEFTKGLQILLALSNHGRAMSGGHHNKVGHQQQVAVQQRHHDEGISGMRNPLFSFQSQIYS